MRSRGLAFGCLLAGGGLALIASAQPWWRGVGEAEAAQFTGSQATGGLSQALAIVALAGTLLMLALRTRARRVVAAVLLLVGLGVALVGAHWLQPRPNVVRGRAAHIGLLDTFGLTATAWPWIFGVAGLTIAAGAAMTIINAGSWHSGSERFQQDEGKTQAATSEEPVELWKAMDAGVDPTINDHDTPTTADPKMRDRAVGDTMDGTKQAQQLPWSPTGPSSGPVQQGRGERET